MREQKLQLVSADSLCERSFFAKKQDMETIKYSKNVLMKDLILFAAIYKTYAMSNFTNHPWKRQH